MQNQKIQLFRKRDFSEKINVTVEFIRQNFREFIIPILYLLGPISVISGLMSYQNIRNTSSTINEAIETSDTIGGYSFSEFTWISAVVILIAVIGYVFVFASVYAYMKLYHDKSPEPINPREVINSAIAEFPAYFLLGLIVMAITMVGMILCVLPGIYLGVVLSFCGAIYMFERGGVTRPIERSFQLIKDNWWETFGLVIIATILGSIISLVFNIPMYIFFGVGMYTVMIDPNITLESSSVFVQIGVVAGLILAQFGQLTSYIIPLIVLGFQYFHLVEEKESVGLMSRIEDLKTE
jgi:hypothetical protein